MLFCIGVDSGQLWCCWSSGAGNLLILQCSDILNFAGGEEIWILCQVVKALAKMQFATSQTEVSFSV